MNRKSLMSLAAALAATLLLSACGRESGRSIEAAGILVVEGDCQFLANDAGDRIALVGQLDGQVNGGAVEIRGKEIPATKCLDGMTIQITEIKKIDPGQLQGPGPGEPGAGGPRLEIVTDIGGEAPPPGGPESAPAGGADVRMFRMKGTLIPDGKKCQAFRNRRGQVFTLTGDLKGLKTGDEVTLEGAEVTDAPCEQPPTIRVNFIERLP
jgi:hypothetical protein